MYIYLLVFVYFFKIARGIKIRTHPLENRICYVHGIKNINNINSEQMDNLKSIFLKHPLLIFKNLDNVTPIEFINFIKNFDNDRDNNALENPDDYQHQMLQPFDQFPDCKHVAPRGNIELLNYHNIKNIRIKPYDSFINNYVWHTDILGHEYKLPNVITGFYIIEQPVIGGDTDFISGETIYENLNKEEQLASHNILIEINRRKFITNSLEIDYAGTTRLENYEERNSGNTFIPLVYAPDNNIEKPRILLMPTFFEKIVGWNIKESREWMNYFMMNKVLPHRVSIQWKKGDLAVFNNRRFIHSSTPARNYLDNKYSSKRLLLQTFIPTTRPLLGIKTTDKDVYSCYNVKWINDQEKSIISAHDNIKFIKNISSINNDKVYDDKYYILQKYKNHSKI